MRYENGLGMKRGTCRSTSSKWTNGTAVPRQYHFPHELGARARLRNRSDHSDRIPPNSGSILSNSDRFCVFPGLYEAVGKGQKNLTGVSRTPMTPMHGFERFR